MATKMDVLSRALWIRSAYHTPLRYTIEVRVLLGLMCLASVAFAQKISFTDRVYPVFQSAGCAACHNANGVASATRLHFPDAEASTARVEAFGKSLVKLVDRNHPEESLLLKKPTMRIPHTGGERIKPGSPEEDVLKAWIQQLTSLSGDELAKALNYSENDTTAGAEAPTAVLRRLTHSQYNNTVRDLLGDQTAPASQFPPEDFVNGFKDQYDAQNLSPLLAEAYSTAAEKLARNAFRNGDAHGLVPCKPSTACRDKFVRSFGLKAFRRPLDPDEVKRYARLFARETDFLKGAQLVVEAMLQSPNFLFRLDETPNPKWKPYATASRLSYTLWDTAPDADLMTAAAQGELATPAGVEKAARRMLDDSARAPGSRRVCFRVAAFRSHPHQQPRPPPLRQVQPRDGHRHDRRGAPIHRRSGMDRPQFHGRLHCRLRLRERGLGGDLRRTGTGGGICASLFPARIGARGFARPGSVSGVIGETGRYVADRPRPVRARTVPLPACAAAAGGRQHEPRAFHRSPSADQPGPHERTCGQSVLRHLPQSD